MENRIDHHTLTILEFDKICSLLAKFSVSEVGNTLCLETLPLSDLGRIRQRLEEVTEMRQLVVLHDILPLHDVSDIAPLLSKAQPSGVYLSPLELIQIKNVLEASRLTRVYFNNAEIPCPTLSPLVSRLKKMSTLETRITESIDPDGTITDKASPTLKAIRAKIRTTKDRIRSRLEDIVNRHLSGSADTGTYITLRNDRYVVPVRSDVKSKVPGVVHDQSRHHATFFIEPFTVVDSNNTLLLLKQDEQEEERAVLESLTDRVREATPHLQNNQRCLAILDAVQARARLSIAMKACAPEIDENEDLSLKQARHPLLLLNRGDRLQTDRLPAFDNKRVVPVELLFPSEFPVSIITGANMGGKTAALKTVGLLTLMAQAGMHIPVAEGSRLPVWQHMFADIGDEQSLERSESTFSSHLGHLIRITEVADKGSLVLLDEVGTGTDPQEGAALALAVIEHLQQRKVKVLVTSHLNLIKSYAVTSPDILTVSVAFDAKTLQPTYSLLYGVPGESKAFETAARLGMDQNLLDNAGAYLNDEDRRALKLIEQVRDQFEAIQASRSYLERLIHNASRYEMALQSLLNKLTQRKADIAASVEKNIRQLFRDVEYQLKQASKASSHTSAEKLTAIRQNVAKLKQDVAQTMPPPTKKPSINLGSLTIGDTIALGKHGQKGRILAVDRTTNMVEVQVGGMRVKAHADDLASIEGTGKALSEADHQSSPRWEPPEGPGAVAPLTLIGLIVDDALPLVAKALDNALLSRQKHVKIIHGYGTGRLKNAIHNFLEQQKTVRNFHLADREEGGAGTTIVEMDV